MDKQKKVAQNASMTVAGMVESIVGCKWSLHVLQLIRQGVVRPGAMEHAVPGLSAKVLNERLRKLTRYGILDKHSYPEVPPRVEYRLTEFGGRFAALLDNISNLQEDLDRGVDRVQGSTAAEIGGKVPGRDPESMHRAE